MSPLPAGEPADVDEPQHEPGDEPADPVETRAELPSFARLRAELDLAEALWLSGELAEALAFAVATLRTVRHTYHRFDDAHPYTLDAMGRLAAIRGAMGDRAAAAALHKEALGLCYGYSPARMLNFTQHGVWISDKMASK